MYTFFNQKRGLEGRAFIYFSKNGNEKIPEGPKDSGGKAPEPLTAEDLNAIAENNRETATARAEGGVRGNDKELLGMMDSVVPSNKAKVATPDASVEVKPNVPGALSRAIAASLKQYGYFERIEDANQKERVVGVIKSYAAGKINDDEFFKAINGILPGNPEVGQLVAAVMIERNKYDSENGVRREVQVVKQSAPETAAKSTLTAEETAELQASLDELRNAGAKGVEQIKRFIKENQPEVAKDNSRPKSADRIIRLAEMLTIQKGNKSEVAKDNSRPQSEEQIIRFAEKKGYRLLKRTVQAILSEGSANLNNDAREHLKGIAKSYFNGSDNAYTGVNNVITILGVQEGKKFKAKIPELEGAFKSIYDDAQKQIVDFKAYAAAKKREQPSKTATSKA